jgi:hypothetical protein
VRTRTTVVQMHTRQGLGPVGGRGNGADRRELAAALQALARSRACWQLESEQEIGRVDGP